LSKFLVPVAPAWYWGEIISQSSGSPVVGVFAAVVLEIGGMLSAHYAIAYHGTARGKLAAAMTGLYLVIGIGVMWLMESANTDTKLVITAVFAIAGMVYLLAAISELEQREEVARQAAESERVAKEAAAETARKEDEAAERRRQQEIEDREIEHQQKMDAAKLKLAHEEKMARIEAQKAAVKSRSDAAQMPLSLPSDFRLLTDQQKHMVSNLSSGELQNMADISASTARRWKQQVSANGSAK
jgi:drug/metabolite transporter superfamily protein YnfA